MTKGDVPTWSILVNDRDEAFATIDYTAAESVTAAGRGITVLSENYLEDYIASHAGIDTVADALDDLGITDIREVNDGT